MIIDGPGPQGFKAKPDPTLIKLLAKAHALQEKLMADGASLTDLADGEGVHRSYVSRLVRLAFLSPEIAQAIVEGRHPPDLTAVKLMRVSRLPLDWPAQKDALGFT